MMIIKSFCLGFLFIGRNVLVGFLVLSCRLFVFVLGRLNLKRLRLSVSILVFCSV